MLPLFVLWSEYCNSSYYYPTNEPASCCTLTIFPSPPFERLGVRQLVKKSDKCHVVFHIYFTFLIIILLITCHTCTFYYLIFPKPSKPLLIKPHKQLTGLFCTHLYLCRYCLLSESSESNPTMHQTLNLLKYISVQTTYCSICWTCPTYTTRWGFNWTILREDVRDANIYFKIPGGYTANIPQSYLV